MASVHGAQHSRASGHLASSSSFTGPKVLVPAASRVTRLGRLVPTRTRIRCYQGQDAGITSANQHQFLSSSEATGSGASPAGSQTSSLSSKDKAKVLVRLHSVRAGETLSSISKGYGVPIEAIKLLNKKTTNSVYVDEVLYLPSPLAELDQARVEGDGNLTVIHVTPRARLMLWKVAFAPVDATAAQNNQDMTVLDKETKQTVAIFKLGKRGEAGVRVSGAVSPAHPAAPDKALFASVQAAKAFGVGGPYGSTQAGQLAAGALFGRGSMALGGCLLLLGSGSALRNALQQQMRPNGVLFNVGSSLRGMLAAVAKKEDSLDPANRTARRYLQELKRGNMKGAKSMRAAMRLGIPTGEEVLLRRGQGPRELVVGLRRKDFGLEPEEIRRHEAQVFLATSATQNEGAMSFSESIEWSIDPMLHQGGVGGGSDQDGYNYLPSEHKASEAETVEGADFESMNVHMAKLANIKVIMESEQE